ncbi:MAG: 2OG-Fe(II) oxygenase [Proteobacteria bacterium]|nr:2OG-Fe(II) oxygenase [Pseudomonadota bacterium]
MANGADSRAGNIFAGLLAERLTSEMPRLAAQFGQPGAARVRCCWVDDVLPQSALTAVSGSLPPLAAMLRRADDKERKYVCADLDRMNPLLRDLIAAFTRAPIVQAVAAITGKDRLESDKQLYNGGMTMMLTGDFMRPHLDNSHDYDRQRRRDLVLLLYLSPDWLPEYGGHLQLWPLANRGGAQTVEFRSNRLVIMETTGNSWHSVQPVAGPKPRVNLTTYFYAPATVSAPLRVTRFTGWPGEPVRSLWFSMQFRIRNAAARAAGRRLVGNQHVYRGSPPRSP